MEYSVSPAAFTEKAIPTQLSWFYIFVKKTSWVHLWVLCCILSIYMLVPLTSTILCWLLKLYSKSWGFPGSSAGKESACNAGDPGSIPGLGKAAVEGIGYPLQYSWDSLVSQMIKNLPEMQVTWVPSLGWEENILAWKIPWTEEPGGLQSRGSKESDMPDKGCMHVHVCAHAHTHTQTHMYPSSYPFLVCQ